MTKDCTHKNYKLSPKFDGPRFEKHHINHYQLRADSLMIAAEAA